MYVWKYIMKGPICKDELRAFAVLNAVPSGRFAGSTMMEFGQRIDGKIYQPRPAAYAVIVNARLYVALIRTNKGLFLPGGGIESGETPEEALLREIQEECGRGALILTKIGEAVQYVDAGGEECRAIHGTFYRAALGDETGQPSEPDHELVWVSASEAINRLGRQSDIWAVTQVVSKGRAGGS